MTKPVKKWKYIDWAKCPKCGCDVAVLSDDDVDGYFYENDYVKCINCLVPGMIYINDKDVASIFWKKDKVK